MILIHKKTGAQCDPVPLNFLVLKAVDHFCQF